MYSQVNTLATQSLQKGIYKNTQPFPTRDAHTGMICKRVLVGQLDKQNQPAVRVHQEVALPIGGNGDGEMGESFILALQNARSMRHS